MSKLFYIAVNYGIQGVNILLNLVFMYHLPAKTLGDIALAKVWLQGLDYTHLGTRFSLDRYLPVTRNEKIKGSYLFVSLCVMTIVSFLFFVLLFIYNDDNKVLLSFTVVGLFLSYINIIKAYHRATGRLEIVNILLLKCYFLPLCISLCSVFYSFKAFLIVYPLSFLMAFGYFAIPIVTRDFHFPSSKYLRTVIMGRMFSTSRMLFFVSILNYSFLVVDRLYVEEKFDRMALGEYSVVMFIFASLFTVPSILTELIFPKVVIQVIEKNRIFFLKEKSIVFFGSLFSIVLANTLMYFLLPYTKYENLYPLMVIASLGVIPYSITAILYHVINALDLRRFLVFSLIASLFTYMSLLFFATNDSLESVVWIKTLSGYILLLFYMLIIVFNKKWSEKC